MLESKKRYKTMVDKLKENRHKRIQEVIMKIERVDHIGVAAKSIDAAL
jgi:hypothetical protein